jgi:hypothetical protein
VLYRTHYSAMGWGSCQLSINEVGGTWHSWLHLEFNGFLWSQQRFRHPPGLQRDQLRFELYCGPPTSGYLHQPLQPGLWGMDTTWWISIWGECFLISPFMRVYKNILGIISLITRPVSESHCFY